MGSLEAGEQSVWFEIWSFYEFLCSFDGTEESVGFQAALNREIILPVCLFPPDCPEVVAVHHSFTPWLKVSPKSVDYCLFCFFFVSTPTTLVIIHFLAVTPSLVAQNKSLSLSDRRSLVGNPKMESNQDWACFSFIKIK